MFDALTLDQLRVFVAVADKGSFRAAAAALGRAQSGLSSAIANLENVLGLELFDRSQHRPVLTKAGTTLLAEARSLLIKAAGFRAHANSFSQGVEPALGLALDPLLPLPLVSEAIRHFQARFPSVRLTIETTPMTATLTQVLAGACDLGFTAADERDPHVLSEAIAAVPGMVAVCRPDHELARRPLRKWTAVDLSDHVQIVISDPSARSLGRDFGVQSQRTYRVADIAIKQALILAGAGWGNLPLWMVRDDLRDGRLVRVLLTDHREHDAVLLPIYALRRIDRPHGMAAAGLCEIITQALVTQDAGAG